MSRYVSPFSAYIEKPEALSTLCVLNRFHLQVSDIPVARTRSHKGMGAQEMERRHIEPWEMCNYSKSPVIFFLSDRPFSVWFSCQDNEMIFLWVLSG